MKTVIALIVGMLIAVPAFAETVQVQDRHLFHQHINEVTVHDKTVNTDTDTTIENQVGVKVDAPNIIKLTKNSSIGVEASKDVIQWKKNDGKYYPGIKEGYSGYVKFTWLGTFFDFSKSK